MLQRGQIYFFLKGRLKDLIEKRIWIWKENSWRIDWNIFAKPFDRKTYLNIQEIGEILEEPVMRWGFFNIRWEITIKIMALYNSTLSQLITISTSFNFRKNAVNIINVYGQNGHLKGVSCLEFHLTTFAHAQHRHVAICT